MIVLIEAVIIKSSLKNAQEKHQALIVCSSHAVATANIETQKSSFA